MVFPNALGYLADELASQGIPSLRFDKFGSGSTGLGGSAPDAFDYGFDMQVYDAEAALNALGELTGILGHWVKTHIQIRRNDLRTFRFPMGPSGNSGAYRPDVEHPWRPVSCSCGGRSDRFTELYVSEHLSKTREVIGFRQTIVNGGCESSESIHAGR